MTKIHLIKIVFYHLIEIMLITWPNFTWPNQLIELFDQLIKKNWWILAVHQNFKMTLIKVSINWFGQVKFDQLTKNKLRNFDQTPKLTETFDQLIRSSEIRSSDRFPLFKQQHSYNIKSNRKFQNFVINSIFLEFKFEN